jgi:hypothetical protein
MKGKAKKRTPPEPLQSNQAVDWAVGRAVIGTVDHHVATKGSLEFGGMVLVGVLVHGSRAVAFAFAEHAGYEPPHPRLGVYLGNGAC